MKYLWEVMVQAEEQGLMEEQLRFKMAERYSPYTELSFPLLNQSVVESEMEIEVNPYCRFYEIFKDLFSPDIEDFPELRQSRTNLLLHSLAQNDQLSGMTRNEYLKKLLHQDFKYQAYGTVNKAAMDLYTREEWGIVLSGILRQFETGSSLDLFSEMFHSLISNNIIYRSNDRPHKLMIFIGQKQTRTLEEKINFLIRIFLEIPFHAELFYEYHFGILGVEDTMMIGEIALC